MTQEELHPLPQGWVWTTLGAVVSPRGVRLSPSEMPEAPFIALEHLEAHTMRLIGLGSASGMKSSAAHFRPGDVLYGRLRPYLNKVYRPEFEGLASGEFMVFGPPSGVDGHFLQYFLNNARFVSFATRLNTGDRPRVDFDQLSPYPLPLAPLPEQRRIVAELEKQFTRLDAAVAALKRTQANLKRYRASVLKAACDGRLVPTEAELARAEGREYEHASALLARILKERETSPNPLRSRRGLRAPLSARGEGPGVRSQQPQPPDTSSLPPLPEGWVWASMAQLTLTGPQNGLYKNRTDYGFGLPILRIEDYQDFSVKPREQLSCLNVTSEEASTYGLQANDLVINRVNSPSHLGKCLVVSDTLAGAMFESNMMRFTVSNHANVRYIALYLRTRNGKVRLISRAKWAVNQASINQVDVGLTSIPMPPLAEQQRIVAEVERRLSVIQAAETVVAVNLKRAERLRQAVLKRAFEGKLVPQDPSDEPASALSANMR